MNPLSPRQTEVLTLIAEGKTTGEIAVILGIAKYTAAHHREQIMQRLGRHNTASLVRYAVAQGLVDAHEDDAEQLLTLLRRLVVRLEKG